MGTLIDGVQESVCPIFVARVTPSLSRVAIKGEETLLTVVDQTRPLVS